MAEAPQSTSDDALKWLWTTWQIRAFVVVSLVLQTFLVLVAPLRKRSSSSWVIVPLWSAYLLADWVANATLGLIGISGVTAVCDDYIDTDYSLLAFWATFFLSHLGGQDTITASSLEDNQLWRRHLLGLLFRCVGVFYVFNVRALPVRKHLRIATILMFITGVIKYSERTRSLYYASASSFQNSVVPQPDPGPDTSKEMGKLPTLVVWLPKTDRILNAANIFKKGELTDLQVVQCAYRFFVAFKGLAVHLRLSFSERNKSREFFLARSAEDAFRVVEVELNFLYEVLFTKFPVMYSKLGYCSRCFSSFAVITSLVLFYLMEKANIYGDEFRGVDVRITYTFLIGEVTLDVIGYIMLIYSNRILVVLSTSLDEDKTSNPSIFGRIRFWLLRKNIGSSWFFLPIMNRKWGESMSTFNLFNYSLHKRPRTRELFYDFFRITRFLDEIWYVDRIKFTVVLRDFIFDELKEKSKIADDLETAKEIFSATGEWVLQNEDYGREILIPFIVDVDLDECLLMWHIATDLCFYDQEDEPLNKDYRDVAKQISDYMIYLLVMRPDMMTEVVGVGLARFQDTCAEAVRFFRSSNVEPGFHFCGLRKKDPTALQRACESILAVDNEVIPVTLRGDKGKSVLFNAAILAKELRNLPQKEGKNNKKIDKWFIMSKVWVELLSFAATHMRSDSHAQQLSKGGDLVTIVWLLMAHFGLGDHCRSIGDETQELSDEMQELGDEMQELGVLDFIDVGLEF